MKARVNVSSSLFISFFPFFSLFLFQAKTSMKTTSALSHSNCHNVIARKYREKASNRWYKSTLPLINFSLTVYWREESFLTHFQGRYLLSPRVATSGLKSASRLSQIECRHFVLVLQTRFFGNLKQVTKNLWWNFATLINNIKFFVVKYT